VLLFYLKEVVGMGDSMEDRLRNLEVRMAMTEQRSDTMAQDVKDIKYTLSWLNKLVLGAIIAAVLNVVITKI
jgi:hypothetical protein